MSSFGAQPSGSFSFGTSSSQPSSSNLPFSFSNPTAPKNPTPLFNSFGASAFGSTTSGSAADGYALDSPMDEAGDDADELFLEPSAFSRKDKAKWKQSGRTMLAAVSPVNGEIAAWVSSLTPSETKKDKLSVSDRAIYFASLNKFSMAARSFYAETYTLFMSLQSIVASSMRLPGLGAKGHNPAEVWDANGDLVTVDSFLGPPNAETVVHMRRLVDMYLEEILKLRDTDEEDETKLTSNSVYHIFNLAEVLYLPQDGRGEGLLGEELLDWVNAVDTVPFNKDGNEIMQAKEPWNQPLFWPYVKRCIMRGFFGPASKFLRTLSSHPHPPIATLGKQLAEQVAVIPRSSNTASYPLDHQFLTAHKTWLSRFRAEMASFIGGRSRGHWFDEGASSSRSEWASWEDEFRCVVELVEGKKDRLFEEAADWREAAGAWGVIVDVGLRRDDLPGVMRRIQDQLPTDSTILDEDIQSSLCLGEIVKALMGCHSLDSWLAAHLGDVFDKLYLIPDDEERFDTSLRDYFLMAYADMLLESPSRGDLWRPIAEYLAAAGDEGRKRLKEYIVHVPIDLDEPRGGAEGGEDDISLDGEENQIDARFKPFAEVQDVCLQLHLDEEWRMITKIHAERLIRRGEFGLAAMLCRLGEDGYTLSRIAEKILTTYVDQGVEEFQRLVNSLPSTMLKDAPQHLTDLHETAVNGDETTFIMYATRLAFLSEFRDYLLYMQQGEREQAAGKLISLLMSGTSTVDFTAVLLAESVDLLEDEQILFTSNATFELMRVLDEVLSNAKYAADDYLGLLVRYLARRDSEQDGADANGKGVNGATQANGKKEKKDAVLTGTPRALRQLDVVRLALARNLSRALVDGFDNAF